MVRNVSNRETEAKAKQFYDRSAKEKSFSDGDMVLVRKPGLHSKVEDSWEPLPDYSSGFPSQLQCGSAG